MTCTPRYTSWKREPSDDRQDGGLLCALTALVYLQGSLRDKLLVSVSSLRSQVVLGSNGEVLLLDLDLGRDRASTVLVDGLLCLCGRLLGVALDSLDSVSGVLVSETLDLGSLLAGDLSTLLELSIDDLLVLDVDERSEVGNEGGDQGQAPERNDLDETV